MTGVLLQPGRVVRMRGRLWRVDRVAEGEFAASPLDGRDRGVRRFHPGLEVISQGMLPQPEIASVGPAEEQDRILAAQRLSLLHGTAPILGLQRSRAIPTDYQLVPLLLSMGREQARLLIADDVGTGKTIEAGLVLSELLARGMARRVLVVVPANLRDQWAEALEHYFHIASTVVAGHLLPALERRLLPGQSVWSSHDVVVASIDYLKTRRETVLSHNWDTIIIDEAHLTAKPHTLPGAAEPNMARWEFARAAAARARHLLLLTATPHNGYTDSFASLISMLDPGLVDERPDGTVTVRRQVAAAHVVQRRRRDIEEWYAEQDRPSPFPERRSDEHIITLTEQVGRRGVRETTYKTLLRELSGYAEALAGMDAAKPLNGWVAAHMQKRALSSPEAIKVTLSRRIDALRKQAMAHTTSGGQAEKEARAAVSDLFESADADDEALTFSLDVAASGMSADEELGHLMELRELARKITPAKDPKLTTLTRLLTRRLDAHPNMRRVMVFTKYRDTLDYLVKVLEKPAKAHAADMPAGLTVHAIHGQMSLADRRRVFAEFERAATAVLIATDCISEGLNLQHACAEIIHYELPWNPNRLEQRNGRVDRFGQHEPFVGINTLVLDDDLDAALLEMIVRKAEQMRADYGFVPPFLANADILAHLSARAAAHRVQPNLFEAAAAEAGAEASRAQMTDMERRALAVIAGADLKDTDLLDRERTDAIRQESFYGHAGVSLPMITEALDRSRATTGSVDAVAAFVTATLAAMPGITVNKGTDGTFTIVGNDSRIDDLIGDATGRATMSFDAGHGFADPDVDVITVAHPLLRRLVDVMADHAAHPDATGRIAARTSGHTDRAAGICHLLVRYVARTDPSVLMEELIAVVSPIWGETQPAINTDAVMSGPPGDDRGLSDVTDAALALLGRDDLDGRLASAAEARATALADRHSGSDAPWASGLGDIEVMSRDLIAATIVWPEVTA